MVPELEVGPQREAFRTDSITHYLEMSLLHSSAMYKDIMFLLFCLKKGKGKACFGFGGNIPEKSVTETDRA